MPTYKRYDTETKNKILKAASTAREAGKGWAETFKAACLAGYKGTKGGLYQLLLAASNSGVLEQQVKLESATEVPTEVKVAVERVVRQRVVAILRQIKESIDAVVGSPSQPAKPTTEARKPAAASGKLLVLKESRQKSDHHQRAWYERFCAQTTFATNNMYAIAVDRYIRGLNRRQLEHAHGLNTSHQGRQAQEILEEYDKMVKAGAIMDVRKMDKPMLEELTNIGVISPSEALPNFTKKKGGLVYGVRPELARDGESKIVPSASGVSKKSSAAEFCSEQANPDFLSDLLLVAKDVYVEHLSEKEVLAKYKIKSGHLDNILKEYWRRAESGEVDKVPEASVPEEAQQ